MITPGAYRIDSKCTFFPFQEASTSTLIQNTNGEGRRVTGSSSSLDAPYYGLQEPSSTMSTQPTSQDSQC